jgi:RimJ/RimL family protein N-acetyltransferase
MFINKNMKKNQKINKSVSNVVFMRGKKTVLRPVLESDIPLFVRWINDPEIRSFISRVFPITETDEREWINTLHKHKEKEVVLVIEISGRPIGSMGIHNINWINRTATTGAVIGEKDFWGKGYGTDAKMVLLNYAFNTLNLRKIISRVFAFNQRSLAYSLHCGYRIEGRLPRQHFVNGKYWDEVILGLFKSQWLPYWKRYCEN